MGRSRTTTDIFIGKYLDISLLRHKGLDFTVVTDFAYSTFTSMSSVLVIGSDMLGALLANTSLSGSALELVSSDLPPSVLVYKSLANNGLALDADLTMNVMMSSDISGVFVIDSAVQGGTVISSGISDGVAVSSLVTGAQLITGAISESVEFASAVAGAMNVYDGFSESLEFTDFMAAGVLIDSFPDASVIIFDSDVTGTLSRLRNFGDMDASTLGTFDPLTLQALYILDY